MDDFQSSRGLGQNGSGGNIAAAFDEFSVTEWAELRQSISVDLCEDDVAKMRGEGEVIDLLEIERIYLPLSQLLSFYVLASRDLREARSTFLRKTNTNAPFLIGLAGSVAVGKSTAARVLREVLSQWPEHPSVHVVTTDGFLRPNAWLDDHGLMHRKGFPESYDVRTLVDFLAKLKAGCPEVAAPVYSHRVYDIVADTFERIVKPDIVIVEGLNVLQVRAEGEREEPRPLVSDFFDFSMYVDADEPVVKQWYVDRFLSFRDSALDDPQAFFHRFRSLSDSDGTMFAERIWDSINGPNLRENVLPTRDRANLILRKNPDHSVGSVQLRRL